MNVGQHCHRSVVAIRDGADIAEAARLMRDQHVGFLVVYSEDDESRKPIGVLTDRDIVLQVIAKDVSPHAVTVEEVMTCKPVVAAETDTLSDFVQAMRLAGVRRAPVVDARGALAGVIAIDDALDVMAGPICDIAGSIRAEQKYERRTRPA